MDFLSVEQKAELSKHFSQPGVTVTHHQLARKLGIDLSDALAILSIFEAQGLSQNKLLIYHVCDSKVLADAIPYGIGFPNLPWKCPHCAEIVENYDELVFDFMSQIVKVAIQPPSHSSPLL